MLASSLWLLRLLGLISPLHAEYYWIKKELVGQLNDALKGRALAKKGGSITQNLGDDDLFIRYALESVSETASKGKVGTPEFVGIASIFFETDSPVCVSPRRLEKAAYSNVTSDSSKLSFDITRVLAQFQVSRESPDVLSRQTRPLHALYRLTMEAISLARYASTSTNQEHFSITTRKCRHIAEWLVKTIELLLPTVYSRLRIHEKFQLASKFRSTGASTYFDPLAGDTYAAINLLHAVNHLAAEFGYMECFDVIKDLCINLVDQSANYPDIQPLRFKAVMSPSEPMNRICEGYHLLTCCDRWMCYSRSSRHYQDRLVRLWTSQVCHRYVRSFFFEHCRIVQNKIVADGLRFGVKPFSVLKYRSQSIELENFTSA